MAIELMDDLPLETPMYRFVDLASFISLPTLLWIRTPSCCGE